MEQILQAVHVTKSYGKKEVLHDVSLTIEPGVIYGLIGRNGAGKTTLLSILTAQNTHDKGTVTYGGQTVWENEKALADLCFSRELSGQMLFGQNTYKVRDYLRAASLYYPHWDKEYADELVKRFGLDTKKKICKLSKGMMSMVTIILALASRAPITILDEPVAGLDVVAREDFYKLLLADYTETGRTFIVSTHIIEEAANVFEKVIIIDNGRIAAVENTEDFVSSFAFVSGKEEDVDAVTKGYEVLSSERFGRQKGVAVRASRNQMEQAATGRDVDVSPVSLQKAFVYLTGEEAHHETA
ncbi:ATP-binding cassette domain-containing protein [uncultured Ruthenibacterium sp.]|uniref:ABC transporter ATP-binding protein n=1 Tax=uncultured Ruthenibacterium sp. TaxID=1905347 RepID=UPI00349EA3E6